jgi:hypothetical protein
MCNWVRNSVLQQKKLAVARCAGVQENAPSTSEGSLVPQQQQQKHEHAVAELIALQHAGLLGSQLITPCQPQRTTAAAALHSCT